MTKPLICTIHNIKRTKVGIKKSLLKCKICAKEKLNNWRKNNKEKIKLQSIRRREKRQDWIKNDRKINPKKWKKYWEKGFSIHGKKYVKQSICRRFKISLEQYEKMFEYYNNKCAICLEPETRKPKNAKKVYDLCIDHCHISEEKGIIKIRGLLCHRCNQLLGNARDNIQLLQNAIEYLKQHDS